MPHAEKSTRTTAGERACPYCGEPFRPFASFNGGMVRSVTCGYCRDLPALEPLDDRYAVREDAGS